MVHSLFAHRSFWLLAALAIACPCVTMAVERAPSAPSEAAVDLFDALRQGQLEVQVIPREARGCRLMMTNKTDKPLTVRLPEAFAITPVLAQFNNNNNNRNMMPWNNNQANSQNNGPQPLGVTTNGQRNNIRPGPMNVGQQRNGGPGPFFNIPPEKTIKAKLPALCLEHGKSTPRAAIPYEIKPLADVTTTPGVADVLAALGDGTALPEVAQLAAWHLNNGIGWQQLAAEKEVFTQQPRYNASQLKAAKKLAEQAVAAAEKRAKDARSLADVAGQ